MTHPDRLKELADKLRSAAEEALDKGDANAALGLLQEARMMDPYPVPEPPPAPPELPAAAPVLEQ